MRQPFFCVSTNLTREDRAVHRRGPLWQWLRASSAIPGILPPVLHHGDVYVDGALVDNLPTDVMADDGLAHITAVSIRPDVRMRTRLEASMTPAWWRLLLHRHDDRDWPWLVPTLTRAAMINSEEISARCHALADLLIAPLLEHIGLLDWKDWSRAVEAGYREAMRVLDHTG
jgi:NTE family protein